MTSKNVGGIPGEYRVDNAAFRLSGIGCHSVRNLTPPP
jgi:hypothetical protein